MKRATATRPAAAQRWLAELGLADLAYLRPRDSGSGWEVRAADGILLGTFEQRTIALAAATQHGLAPVNLH